MSEHRGYIISQSGEMNTRSSTERTGSSCLLVHVYQALDLASSRIAMDAIALLNMDTRAQLMLQLFLSAHERIRLKSPYHERDQR